MGLENYPGGGEGGKGRKITIESHVHSEKQNSKGIKQLIFHSWLLSRLIGIDVLVIYLYVMSVR